MALAAAVASFSERADNSLATLTTIELGKATELLFVTLYPKDINSPRPQPTDPKEIQSAVRLLTDNGRVAEVFSDFMDLVGQRFHLVKSDLSRYINRLTSNAALAVSPDTTQIVVEMLDRLAAWQRLWGTPVRHLNNTMMVHHFGFTFQSMLHASLPPIFPEHLRELLTASLSALPQHLQEPPQQCEMLQTIPVNYQKIAPPSAQLQRLGILPRYATTVNRVAYEEIERIAREEADKGWDTRRLTRARQRVGDGVANWLSGMFEPGDASNTTMRPMFQRFDYYLCKCFFDIRTDELFDIIVDYPDSLAALEDLKECLFKVDQRSVLVDKLRAANVKRLLHPGADTKDVITQYISTIRCLRILDPPGVLLHKVAEPIRRHLKDRPDTVKCVVAALVEGDELQDENEAGGLIQANNDDTVEDFTDAKWEPEPIDAAPQFRSGKASDIISTLVSIYDTREVIIKELQVLLAQRLLAVKDYDAVKEIRTIELLKLRFGETTLQVCDVMLKDMADSKRIDDRVQGDAQLVVHPLVISRMFWPNIPSSSLHLTPKLEQMQRQYETAFHHFKPDKRLRWLQHIGTATVRLELEDRIVEVEATPLQAAVSELFETQAVWDTVAMGEKLGVDLAQVRNGLAFWANEGVVAEENGQWRLLEVAEEGVVATTFVEEGSIIEHAQQGNADSVRVYWQFIKGMLTSLGPKTIEEIQRNLESFADDYGQSQDELGIFMQSARQEGLVDQKGDGRWVLL